MTWASDIRAAGDSLTHQTWAQTRYFVAKSNQVCMCAHGAMLAQSNQKVNDLLFDLADDSVVNPIELVNALYNVANCSGMHGAGAAAGWARSTSRYVREDLGVRDDERAFPMIWDQRPSWVRSNGVEGNYLLGMVGMTPLFNDAEGTTLEMIKDKFRQAAELADRLGV